MYTTERAGYILSENVREQFKLSSPELQTLGRICLLTITLYTKAGCAAPNSCSAPYNDLSLLQAIDTHVATVAPAKLICGTEVGI